MKTIAVMNQKGGTGKTTSAINLAGELVRRGKKVLIVDMDTQGNATSNLQLTEVPPYTLTDVIVSKTAVLADTICHTSIEHLDLIRGGGLLAPALAAMQEMPFGRDTHPAPPPAAASRYIRFCILRLLPFSRKPV